MQIARHQVVTRTHMMPLLCIILVFVVFVKHFQIFVVVKSLEWFRNFHKNLLSFTIFTEITKSVDVIIYMSICSHLFTSRPPTIQLALFLFTEGVQLKNWTCVSKRTLLCDANYKILRAMSSFPEPFKLGHVFGSAVSCLVSGNATTHEIVNHIRRRDRPRAIAVSSFAADLVLEYEWICWPVVTCRTKIR